MRKFCCDGSIVHGLFSFTSGFLHAIMHLTDSARYAIVMVKEIDHDTRRIKQCDLS